MIRVDLARRRRSQRAQTPPAPRRSGRSLAHLRAMPNSRVGELWSVELAAQLFARKLLKRPWLLMALERRQETGEPLSSVLEAIGVAGKRLQVEVLAEYLKVPSVDLGESSLDPDVMALIPVDISIRMLAVAIDRKGDTLRVAMPDPTDPYVLELLRQETGMRIEGVLAFPASLRRALVCRNPLDPNGPIDSGDPSTLEIR